jgi:hypothetical protein
MSTTTTSRRTSRKRLKKQKWAFDINPVALATMRRLAAGQDVLIRKPDPEWLEAQFQKLYDDGSFGVPALAEKARADGLAVMYAELYGRVFHADGTVTDYGLLGRRVVTTAGVAFLADAFTGDVEPENLKYAGFGTGTTAESAAHTALVTELTTEYATDNVRPTGSLANSTNTFTTVATLSPNAGGTIAVAEHGIFDQASNAGGTLWDRTTFTAINLVASSDSLQSTYVLTLPSGS